MEILIACLLVGMAGFLAGLLGVGGGMVIVPALLYVFPLAGLPTGLHQHMALATSMATIVVTAVSSARAHHAKGAVRWLVLQRITPGIVAGCLTGAILARWLPGQGLQWLFVVFAAVVALQMLLDYRPRPGRELPGAWGTNTVGAVIGMLSSWVGIGGGSLSVPFLVFCNVSMREAIGTSAAIGLPLALAGTLGYILAGWGLSLPKWSLGYVYLPALAGIVLTSVPMAKLGAAAAHRLPVAALKRGFAILLLLLAVRMFYGLVVH